MAGTKDVYANQATISMVESAPNTLTFKKLETGLSIGAKVAWILSRIEYWYNPVFLVAAADAMFMGISQATSWANPLITEETILDLMELFYNADAAPVSSRLDILPYYKDFSSLPGGGLLFVPNPLYGFLKGTSLAAAGYATIKLFYTQKEVSDSEFYELWQSRVQLTA